MKQAEHMSESPERRQWTMKRNQGKRILAILLSAMLMISNLGITAFAENITSEPAEVYVDEEALSDEADVTETESESAPAEELTQEAITDTSRADENEESPSRPGDLKEGQGSDPFEQEEAAPRDL